MSERLLVLGSEGVDVVDLQRQLRCLGFEAIGQGGAFDERTLQCVLAFQRHSAIKDDGQVGPLTLAALNAEVGAQLLPDLHDYRGCFGFLLREEGHRGVPYWPGGFSGVTLDPGFDLGYQRGARLTQVYGRVMTPVSMIRLERALGVRGEAAHVLAGSPAMAGIRISRSAAGLVLPHIASRFWQECVVACPALLSPTAPAAAHTALLSLAYNAGADDVRPLARAAHKGAWRKVAEQLGMMHRSHTALHARREREAALILAELG